MMNLNREALVDRMVKIYGFENPIVIQFCELCEKYEVNEWNDTILQLLVEAHEASPVFEEE